MKKSADILEPEFSVPLTVDKVPPSGLDQSIAADANQRVRLAQRFGLLELPKLQAELSIMPARAGSMLAVTGRMEADVVQQCVVTLEPLPAHIEQEIDVLFAAPDLIEGEGGDGPEGEDLEPIIGGRINLGELLAQHLGVALDPYPRKPGIEYVEAQYGDAEKPANPFTVLAGMKKNPKK